MNEQIWEDDWARCVCCNRHTVETEIETNPLRRCVQASGAYCLCARCETVAKQELRLLALLKQARHDPLLAEMTRLDCSDAPLEQALDDDDDGKVLSVLLDLIDDGALEDCYSLHRFTNLAAALLDWLKTAAEGYSPRTCAEG